jgi:hypothetical protein
MALEGVVCNAQGAASGCICLALSALGWIPDARSGAEANRDIGSRRKRTSCDRLTREWNEYKRKGWPPGRAPKALNMESLGWSEAEPQERDTMGPEL